MLLVSGVQIDGRPLDMSDLAIVEARADIASNGEGHLSFPGAIPLDQCLCAFIFGIAEEFIRL